MQGFVRLRKTGSGWEFESEIDLEDFVWANLQQLLGLIPLKRQYRVNSQICDIVAIDENKRLVVLELKNCEDRYVVQQLTRYYDALLEEKAFNQEIDYGQPVRLVAIAPSFHKDNFTDRKYHKLFFQFVQFNIIQTREKFCLQLEDIDIGKVSKVDIIYQQRDSTENIPAPPRALLNLLSKGNDDAREVLLQIRETILSFDQRMKEVSASGVISYGKGKSKPCAEIRILSFSKKPGLILWLPNPKIIFNQKRIGRMRIYTKDWNKVSRIDYMPKGTRFTRDWWEFEEYVKLIGINKLNSLENIVEIALETWLKRL
jgi:RecB family endonuclease NucS